MAEYLAFGAVLNEKHSLTWFLSVWQLKHNHMIAFC